MIGLLDPELFYRQFVSFPNLEIMKLHNFFEKNGVASELILDMKTTKYYEAIHIRCEGKTVPIIPSNLQTELFWGGSAFEKDRAYKPFETLEIEYTPASPKAYAPYYRTRMRYWKHQRFLRVLRMLNQGSFVRLHNGIDNPFFLVGQDKPVFIYDRDIFQDDWQDKLLSIKKQRPSNFICRYPIRGTPEQIAFLLENKICTGFYQHPYNYPIILDAPGEIDKFMREYEPLLHNMPNYTFAIPTTEETLYQAYKRVLYWRTKGYKIRIYPEDWDNPILRRMDYYIRLEKIPYTFELYCYQPCIRPAYEEYIQKYPQSIELFRHSLNQIKGS